MTVVIQTERLQLRRLRDDDTDAAAMLELLNVPGFLRHIGDRGVRTLEQARTCIRNSAFASYAAHGFGMYVIERRDDGAWLGNAGLVRREGLPGPDLGYALLARYGMIRDGHLYRCDNNQPDTIVLFCHFGIMMACIGHLLGVSPMLLWHGFCTQPSSVTTLVTEERVKGEVVFRCMQSGDLSHLYAADEPYSTAALFPECYTGRDSTDPPEWDALGYR